MPESLPEFLRRHTCLYASFDRGLDADVCRGDGRATVQPSVVQHEPGGGRFGGAAVFSAADYGTAEDEFRYPAAGSFPYDANGFEGTISIWLCGDPDADLSPKYPVDPFHISRRAADGSFYLDLTRPNDARYGSPRKLRFGLYNDSPENNRFVNGQLVVVGELEWKRGDWHHVAATFRNANSGRDDGRADVYIDGVRRGWMEGYTHRVTWDIASMHVGLGQRYTGRIDEVLVLDAAMSGEQVDALYRSGEPAGRVLI